MINGNEAFAVGGGINKACQETHISHTSYILQRLIFLSCLNLDLVNSKGQGCANNNHYDTLSTVQILCITCLSSSCFWRHRMFCTLFGLILRRCDKWDRKDSCYRRAHSEHAACTNVEWTLHWCACSDAVTEVWCSKRCPNVGGLNLLKTKRDLLYLKIQFVPRSKHFPPRL